MSRSTAKQFDLLEFVHGLKEHGVKEDLAEYQARQLAQVIDIASAKNQKTFKMRELATQKDLKQLEIDLKTIIKQMEADLRKDMKQLDINIKQLEIKLEQYRYDSLKFTVWTGIGVVMFLSSLLAKGFHWLS